MCAIVCACNVKNNKNRNKQTHLLAYYGLTNLLPKIIIKILAEFKDIPSQTLKISVQVNEFAGFQ